MKPKQGNAVECLLKKDDVLAVLPTGYSKSLHIFELFGVAASIEREERQAVLVVWLFGMGIPGPCAVNKSPAAQNFTLIVGSAETVMDNRFLHILKDNGSAQKIGRSCGR